MNLELRVKEPAPPSPALSEFKKIFSHTRLKLPPLGFTSLTLSLEPALLLKFVIPFEICNSKTWFLPSESFSCWPPKESEVEILAWGVPPPPYFCSFAVLAYVRGEGGDPLTSLLWCCKGKLLCKCLKSFFTTFIKIDFPKKNGVGEVWSMVSTAENTT